MIHLIPTGTKHLILRHKICGEINAVLPIKGPLLNRTVPEGGYATRTLPVTDSP